MLPRGGTQIPSSNTLAVGSDLQVPENPGPHARCGTLVLLWQPGMGTDTVPMRTLLTRGTSRLFKLHQTLQA